MCVKTFVEYANFTIKENIVTSDYFYDLTLNVV